MTHYKMMKSSEKNLYSKLDYYNYSDFDDDYYYDIIEEKTERRSKRKRAPRRGSRYAQAFQNYVKDF